MGMSGAITRRYMIDGMPVPMLWLFQLNVASYQLSLD